MWGSSWGSGVRFRWLNAVRGQPDQGDEGREASVIAINDNNNNSY